MTIRLGSYGVILSDWPAHFDTYSAKGAGKSPQRHYPTMTVEEACRLPVAALAAPDCALFFWATWPRIFESQTIIKRWGFKYSGLAWEWLKFNEDTQKFAFGGGLGGTRKNLEPCLLARRGSPVLLSRSERDFIFERRREHSRKPDQQYERIERMFAGPRIELFARARRPGWESWGNEVDKFEGSKSDAQGTKAEAAAVAAQSHKAHGRRDAPDSKARRPHARRAAEPR